MEKVKSLFIKNYIENKYKPFSLYVCSERALPHLIDGFKAGQRKIMYVSMKRAQTNIKTEALAGYVQAESNYHHAPTSLSGTISLMAQSFCGSNNYPFFSGKGGFGNIFGAKYSAPRYTEVKIADVFNKLYLKEDSAVALKSTDIEDPEPQFYIPIIPTVLLNGCTGVAVAYACDFPSYHPSDIIDCIYRVLDKKNNNTVIRPFFKNYNGNIVKENERWIQYGSFNRINKTTLEITELPFEYSNIDTYKVILNEYIENGTILDYDDMSDSKWRVVVKAKKELIAKTDEELISIFKLRCIIPENINVIFDGKVIEYKNDTNLLIEHFVAIRLDFYEKRKRKILTDFQKDIIRLFIKFIVNKYVISKKEKALNLVEVTEFIENKKEVIENYFKDMLGDTDKKASLGELQQITSNVLRDMKFNEIFTDKMADYQKSIEDITQKHNDLCEKTAIELYKEDLKIIRKILI